LVGATYLLVRLLGARRRLEGSPAGWGPSPWPPGSSSSCGSPVGRRSGSWGAGSGSATTARSSGARPRRA